MIPKTLKFRWKSQMQNPKTKPRTNNSYVLIFVVYFTALIMQCSSSDGPHRPYRPHGPVPGAYWSVPFTILPVNWTLNTNSSMTENVTSSYVPTVVTAEPLTESSMPGEDYTEVYGSTSDDWRSWAETRDEELMTTITYFTDFETTEETASKIVLKTPEEELNQMLEGLDNLLSNESAVVTVGNVTDAFDQLDVLLETDDLEFPCSMLVALDTLGTRADLNGSQAVAAARQNVAVIMADSTPAHPVRGLRIAATSHGFSDEGFEVFHGDMDPNLLSTEDSDAVVNLPQSLSESSRRFSFVVFRSDRAFLRHESVDQYIVNSRVISVNVENYTQLYEGEVVDVHFKPAIHNPARNMTRACAYWHFADNGTGHWSQEGCTFIASPSGLLATCRCTHLTHFAEVLVPKAVFSEENEKALKIISLTGCFLSLFGLIVIGLTAIVFRSWRNDFNNKIWIQLTFALLVTVICFLIIVFSRFEDYSMFCFFVGVLLHYSVLASFCWMLVAAIISYRKLVLIFARDPSRKLLKASAFSWFCPLAIVTILVAVSPESYVKRFEDKIPNAAFCYPSGLALWLSVYTPIAVIVLTNWILFALIIRSVFATRKIQKHGDSGEFFRRASVSCLLVFLFGLPWVFGLFAYNIVAAYLFTLTTSYQGFVLFIFFVIINSKTRNLWLNKFKIKKKTKAPLSSSLATNRSETARDESEKQAFIEPTSTRTNVTSLMSNATSCIGRAVEYNVSRGSAVIEDTNSLPRYESEDSFVTAKSFMNIHDDERDENLASHNNDNSLNIVIRSEVEEKDDKLSSEFIADRNNLSTGEQESADYIKDSKVKKELNHLSNNNVEIVATSTPKRLSIDISTANDLNENSLGNGSYIINHEVGMPHRISHDHDDNIDNTDNQSYRGESSPKPSNDDSNSPEISIYNIPTQSASLIS